MPRPLNILHVQPSGADAAAYWAEVGRSPYHVVMVHCSNYEDNSYQAYPFSTLEKARMWLSTCGYDCVVVSTAMIDDPGYGNRLDS